MTNPARAALTNAVNKAIAEGAPVYENVPADTKHTPGPWIARRFMNGNWEIAEDATARTTCQAFNEADARLIAAAPDLLASLDALLRWTPEASNPDDANGYAKLRREARAALSKAGA